MKNRFYKKKFFEKTFDILSFFTYSIAEKCVIAMSISGKNMSNCDKINILYNVTHQLHISILGYASVVNLTTWNNPDRIAPFWRFYWSFSSGSRLIVKGKNFELDTQYPVLIPPYFRFCSCSDGPLDQFYIHFSLEHFRLQPSQPILLKSFGTAEKSEIQKHFEAVQTANTAVWLNYLICKALLELEIRSGEMLDELRTEYDPRIETALKLMDEKKKLTNSEIAQRIGMSTDNFIRLFKREIGITPKSYKNSRRMELAQTLLMDKKYSIDDIAVQCGFVDRYQFSKQFTAYYNISPGRYRKHISKNV